MRQTFTRPPKPRADFAERLTDHIRMALPRLKDADLLDLADMLHEAIRARRAEHHLTHERRLL